MKKWSGKCAKENVNEEINIKCQLVYQVFKNDDSTKLNRDAPWCMPAEEKSDEWKKNPKSLSWDKWKVKKKGKTKKFLDTVFYTL